MSIFLDFAIGDDGLGWVSLRDPCDEVFYLAVVAVTATPTANNLLLMTELAGGNKAAMSTCIFLQYLVAPLVLTITLTVLLPQVHNCRSYLLITHSNSRLFFFIHLIFLIYL